MEKMEKTEGALNINQTPDISSTSKTPLTVEKGGQHPEVFQDGMATAESFASMGKEKIETILENNPSLIQKLTPMVKKYWNIGKVVAEAAIAGFAISKMQFNSHEELDLTPGNIAALVITAPLILKIVYDLIPQDKKKVIPAKA